jgi:glycosyltransferase involved in cell wall biosynthesis
MKTVIIYKAQLLAVSETFIAEQVRALRSFTPKYVALMKAEPSLSFEGEPLYLNSRSPSRWSRWRVGMYRRIPLAPIFHRRLEGIHADLVHAHFASDGLQITSVSERLRLPLVVTLHGADVTEHRQFYSAYRKLWRRASMFICVSEFIRNRAIEAGFPSEKMRVHHIGIDLRKFCPPESPRVPGLILFVGRLVEKKGCGVLLRAMNEVCRAVPGASLVVIGDGPLRAALIEAASRIPCNFLGAQPASEVHSWMQKASVFCGPSQTSCNGDSEGLGMVFLEAQSCKLPVVSTLHGGIPEAIKNGESGLLVPEGDSGALAHALIRYLKDPGIASRHGAFGRAWVERHFDLFKQTQKLEELYDEVLSFR